MISQIDLLFQQILQECWWKVENWSTSFFVPVMNSICRPILTSLLPNLPLTLLSDSNHTMFVAIAIVPMIFFYVYGAMFVLIDTFCSASFRERYKVQANVRISTSQYLQGFYISLFNWLCLTFPYLAMLSYVIIPQFMATMPTFPTLFTFFRDLLVYIVVEEVFFYFSHRLLHTSMFYSKIHKFHHTFTAPFAIAAVYAHPIEHMLSNVIPVSLGSLIMQSHPVLPMIWGVLALFNTMTVHSGYDFSCFLVFPAPYFHDWHHEKFNENFGAIQLLDYVFETNKHYLQAIQRGEVFVPRNHKKDKKII